ncbi:MAG: DNA topoisomerase IB [Candidatus Thermoplasmatota archaeon]|nr:DNA topoisomerase IB [Candidatus Thermoplasmatota archaeon]MEC8997136.1 DNA topoisomerase IB [Candidatus Thermoplasmatota archaeon]MED6305832.1 DNA topoisomerase IB [Candidatus Thermoplasmatota archaeon]
MVSEKKVNAIADAEQAGLYYSSNAESGYTRKMNEKESLFFDMSGKPLKSKRELKRAIELRIPPAWTKVWICDKKNGHLQATGIDAKKRTQYIYHPIWTQLRSEAKFDKMVSFGEALPKVRDQYFEDLAKEGNQKQNNMPYERVMALIVRLLDTTFIRIGNETSRDDEKATYGLSTMQDEHMDFEPTEITDEDDKWYDSQVGGKFTFVGKSGKKHEIEIKDEIFVDLPALVMLCKYTKKEKGGDLFAFFDGEGKTHDVKAYHVNEYIQEIAGGKFTAKDFRTWGGTKLAARELNKFKSKDNKAQRKKNVTKMVKAVSSQLGNTPAVCRGSYIHPRFIGDYLKGSFFRLWKESLEGENLIHLTENESHVIRYLKNR